MAVRKIVKIDEDLCNGCGECIISCAEGALQIIDGKARIVKEIYCDGLGACLGTCPTDAITIEEREADQFDEEAVEEHLAQGNEQVVSLPMLPCGCPGSAVQQRQPAESGAEAGTASGDAPSQLSHWPVQLTLVPPNAPFLKEADLLLVADCVPFAMAGFHERFLRGRPIVIGCPKLDDPQAYIDKLAAMVQESSLRSLTVIHMEVPCCSGLCGIAKQALKDSGRDIPAGEVTISVDGRVIPEEDW